MHLSSSIICLSLESNLNTSIRVSLNIKGEGYVTGIGACAIVPDTAGICSVIDTYPG